MTNRTWQNTPEIQVIAWKEKEKGESLLFVDCQACSSQPSVITDMPSLLQKPGTKFLKILKFTSGLKLWKDIMVARVTLVDLAWA